MLMLALDQSTSQASCCIVRDDRVVAETQRALGPRGADRPMTATLADLMAAADATPGGIDLFAVGIGPGAFSGLRAALAGVCALALPGRKPVVTIASARAIAADVLADASAETVAVVGDARRRRLWLARYAQIGGHARTLTPLQLIPDAALEDLLDAEDAVATPDWERLGADLGRRLPRERLATRPSYPRAARIAKLAALRFDSPEIAADQALKDEAEENKERVWWPPYTAVAPIYLHPPVFVEPRRAEEVEDEESRPRPHSGPPHA
jgi:tRNA threonylcarbamoyladenosine biosynthesis protein TsaB